MSKVNAILVGTGGMARHHIRGMLKQTRTTRIQAMVEVSEEQRQITRELFQESGKSPPPFYRSISELLKNETRPDAAFIVTPHKFHLENARDCLNAGLDVLLEKPMVINAGEARRLIRVRDRTRRILVVAFPGSLSPATHKAKKLIASGKIGEVTGVAASVHQRWKVSTHGTWRQDPSISGGGFLFDTGSHMINTVVDIIGSEVAEVSALLDNAGAPVEINSAISGRFRNGIVFSLGGFGDSISCIGSIRIFGREGILEIGMWGEYLKFRSPSDKDYTTLTFPRSLGVWQQFLRVREGKLENPCPPEVGLRFSQLMDMIRKSEESGRRVRSRVRKAP